MYILTEKENNKLNFYSESGDGVKLFEDLNSLRATVETLQDAERELFGDLKTEFGYIEFDEEDIMTNDSLSFYPISHEQSMNTRPCSLPVSVGHSEPLFSRDITHMTNDIPAIFH